MVKLLILAIFAVVWVEVASEKFPPRFVANILHYTHPRLSLGEFHCLGTIISSDHVLTAASCVIVEEPFRVAVSLQSQEQSFTTPVTQISTHPSFDSRNDRLFNVAVLKVDSSFDTSLIRPFSRFGMPTNFTCNLYGWGQQEETLRADEISVYGPQFCDVAHPHVSCSTFENLADESCSAALGSPVVCEEQLAGFLISNGCIAINGVTTMNIDSISIYRTWVESVLRAEADHKDSREFTIEILEIRSGDFSRPQHRCVGTIFSDRLVLSTASCVSVTEGSTIAINVLKDHGMLIEQVEKIHVHPEFKDALTNNVALIKTISPFNDQDFIPRSLETSSYVDCFLIGWGGDLEKSNEEPVTILQSDRCEANNRKTVCSSFTSGSHAACSARRGSPVICGTNRQLAGVLLNEGTCSPRDGRFELSYHSVQEFESWIKEVTGASSTMTSSVVLLVAAFLVKFFI